MEEVKLMIDREKIIEICKKCIESDEPTNDYQFYYSVLELLKEREPIIPVMVTAGCTQSYICDECCSDISKSQKFCSGCGREIKWD